MYREQQENITLNFLFNNGGFGDCIGSLPALNYVYKNHPHVTMHIWMGDFAVEFAKRSLPVDSERILIRGFSDIKDYNNTQYARCVGFGSTHTNFATHQTKHAFSMLVNAEPEIQDMNYLPMDQTGINLSHLGPLPENYVVLPIGFTAVVREWLPKHVNEVAAYIRDKGYTPVFIGKSESPNGAGHVIKGNVSEGIDYSLGLNLMDKTSLCEAQVLISKAKAIVGLDCGMLHVAGTTEIPIVGGFTTVKPMHRMPVRHNEVGWNFYPVFLTQEQLSCSGCQSNMAFTHNHRFDTCLYGDKICIELLTADMYIKKLEEIL